MKFVLDASVALKWVFSEANSARAIRLRDEHDQLIHDLIAPDIFFAEVANGLAVAERQGRIKSGESASLFFDIARSAPRIHRTSPLIIRAMEIAVSTRQGVYDCIYIALAEAEGCQMVSGDEQLIRKLQPTFPVLVRLTEIP